ncbi:MAG: hypothetical protein HC902_07755 [Calothrix sp. SM1_5_4]|nr:hypothetical protein [Calothrix sp. SM1_5_4]
MDPIRSVLTIFVCALTFLSLPHAASAQSRCRAIDLRVPGLNRPQSQIFKSADGKEVDSGMCASFSNSLLVSQRLGIAINPVDGAVRSTLSILSRMNQELAEILKTGRYEGACRQAAVDIYLEKEGGSNFTQAFSDFVHRLNPNADVEK